MASSPLLIQPRRFGDDRGWFCDTFRADWIERFGLPAFGQDCEAFSAQSWTFRGFHYQKTPHAQAKLVRCVRGQILDIVVDIRRGSPTFGHALAQELSMDNGRQLFVPVGFAHGYLTLSDNALVAYKIAGDYAPDCEAGLRYNDPALQLQWPAQADTFHIKERDRAWPDLDQATTPFVYDGVDFALKPVEM